MYLTVVKYASLATGCVAVAYLALLAMLTTPTFQAHVVYLHAVQMTWFKNLDIPEIFGFLHNQVTPFSIQSGNETLYAWHILPIEAYRKHEHQLLAEASGFVQDFQSRRAFQLLHGDPEALLVVHMHGAAGTVGSGYRASNYRALSNGRPDKIHVLTFDYRGFGRSTGEPSEPGVLLDAVAVLEWAMNVAQIPPHRIIIFGQSLGTAVNIAVAEYYAKRDSPITFAGHILVAPFIDAATLVSTYSVAGTIPLLGPIAKYQVIFDYLRTFIQDSWSTKDRIAEFVRLNEANNKKFRLTMIHAEDDYDIPWQHTPVLFHHAINATLVDGASAADIDQKLSSSKQDLGSAGSVRVWATSNGIIREEILKHGLHDVVMGYPVISMAVMRIFAEAETASV